MSQTTTHYIAVLIRQARRLGLDVDRILSETGIAPELSEVEDQWIDNRYVTALVKKMWQETNDETFGIDPAPLRIGTWALACEFMLAADTLGELLRKGERILSYLAPGSAGIETVIEGDSLSVLPGVYTGEQDPTHFLMEFMAVVWHRFPSWAINENIQLQKAFFSYPSPPHGYFYEEFFQCDVEFEQPRSGFSFSRKYLKKPIVRNKTDLNNWLRDSPADLLYVPGRETSVQSQIQTELRRELEEQMRFPAFESICTSLQLSPQVVRRRLSEEGTSYQKIKDMVRRDLALELLSTPELLIADIAERTGFTEPAAFSRAFKKWAGISPVQYRENKFPEK
jgi:AraC-like DNA-binding protein